MDISNVMMEQIGKNIGIENLKDQIENGSIEIEKVLMSLNAAIEQKNKEIEKKKELLSKCSGALMDLREENDRLRRSQGIEEETLKSVENRLKDFSIKNKYAIGEITEDQLIKSLLQYMDKQPVSSFAILQLNGIDYKLEESDCYESLISKLVSQIKSKESKIKEQENRLNYIEARLQDGQEAIKRIENEYPGIFDVANEQYVVEQGYINFDGAVDSLLKKCKELEQNQAKEDITEEPTEPAETIEKPTVKFDSTTLKVKELFEQGYTRVAIAEKLGIGKNKVSRICKSLER